MSEFKLGICPAMGATTMRSGKRGRRTTRVVLILTIAAGVALAIVGGGAAFADVVWTSGQVDVVWTQGHAAVPVSVQVTE
jgi:hypothetical protein